MYFPEISIQSEGIMLPLLDIREVTVAIRHSCFFALADLVLYLDMKY